MTPADARTGILEVELSLQLATAKATHRIGSAELHLEGESARLVLPASIVR